MTGRKRTTVKTIRAHLNVHQIHALQRAIRFAPIDGIMRRKLIDILNNAVAVTVTKTVN